MSEVSGVQVDYFPRDSGGFNGLKRCCLWIPHRTQGKFSEPVLSPVTPYSCSEGEMSSLPLISWSPTHHVTSNSHVESEAVTGTLQTLHIS